MVIFLPITVFYTEMLGQKCFYFQQMFTFLLEFMLLFGQLLGFSFKGFVVVFLFIQICFFWHGPIFVHHFSRLELRNVFQRILSVLFTFLLFKFLKQHRLFFS